MSLRILASAAVAAGAVIAVVACGSGIPAALAAARPPAQVTGDQLSSALLPPSYFGPDYQAGIGFTSGSQLNHERAPFTPATMGCWSLGTPAVTTAFGETAYAESSDSPTGSTGQKYLQIVFQFPSYRASTAFYSAEDARDAKCTSYSSTPHPMPFSITVRQSVSKMHVGGHQAFLVVQSVTYAGVAGVTKVYLLEAIDGADVFMVVTSGANIPATHPTAAAAAGQLIAQVSALR